MKNIGKVMREAVEVLGYVHLADFLLNMAGLGIVQVLLFLLVRLEGWLLLAWAVTLYLLFREKEATSRKSDSSEVKVRDHSKCKPPKPIARKQANKKKTKAPKKVSKARKS